MQTFPRETTDYIARQFCAYFDRKKPQKMTIADAQKLIDYVSGPAPRVSGIDNIDYSRPRVSGGGRRRPSDIEIENMIKRYYNEDTYLSDWDEVFDMVIRYYKRKSNQEVLQLIKLAFKEQKKCENVCKTLHISERSFYNNRLQILNKSAVFAISIGLQNCIKNCNDFCSSDY
jgi:hypothetical protein